MTALFLSLHVLAAILTVGPVAITASMFPPVARRALAAPDDASAAASVRLLHRVTRVYAAIGVAVPVLGYITGATLGVLSDAWLIASMVLTAAAAAVLIVLVLPGQRRVVEALEAPGNRPATARLSMHAGIFNLLWAVVVVLMVYRPGSTTGAGL
ncbi:hypothetical protein ACFQHV_21495 [Promicromonospora thailandica]|uniref:Integral membrane protein (DUF2269) n=1 Tax=Promicromonospora thailandica TaxID=765201 RepID=A0A9X2FY00_9MICO|nr:hypothetical protein [Promicromonospora thailandica]MCP2263219.1 putative integral membrane protein (DUF2269) [Promicromonospora thailandica]BFF18607.1 membrane protein [Promicromonospora thailandica]